MSGKYFMMRMVDYPNIYYQQYMPDLACSYKCTEWSVCLSHLDGCVILVHTRQTETMGRAPQKSQVLTVQMNGT